MPSKQDLKKAKKKVQNNAYYDNNRDAIRAQGKQSYAIHSSTPKAGSKLNLLDPSRKQEASKRRYASDPSRGKAASMLSYASDPSRRKEASKKCYASDQSRNKRASKQRYASDKDELKKYFKQYFRSHKHVRHASFKKYYDTHKHSMQAARLKYYVSHRHEEIAAARARNLRNAMSVLRRARRYYASHRHQCCSDDRWRYELAEPKHYAKEQHVLEITKKVIVDSKALPELIEAFRTKYKDIASEMTAATCKRAVSSMAAKIVVNKVMQVRKRNAGAMLKAIRCIRKIALAERADFGNGLHCAHSEPYFYESAYLFEQRPETVIVDEHGRCRPTCNEADKQTADTVPKYWKCSSKCKPLADSEVSTIMMFKSVFDQHPREVRKVLDKCDDCPNHRYTKASVTPHDNADSNVVQLGGHGLQCYTGNECCSELRMLRVASTHFPNLRFILHDVYDAIRSHRNITAIDEALRSCDIVRLMTAADIDSCDTLFDSYLNDTSQLQADDGKHECLQKKLLLEHAKIIALFQKAVGDYAQHPCFSCHRLFQSKGGGIVRFTDKLGTVWPTVKQNLLKLDCKATLDRLFMCTYCKAAFRKNNMPPRCVLNGLQTVHIPAELAKLDCLSRQFIQKAKAYQTVVRLGTYTHKVPAYNSLKACKGTMFFLPLPLEKTMATLDEVKQSELPNPELYIIVNGKPTKNNVVWRSLVQINDIKAAVRKLKECNWLYKDTDDACIDSAAKEVIEVVSEASCTMLEKATAAEVSQFQCYTIRNLDNKLSTESDIEQYKLLNVTEKPLDNRQRHLDAMCFPVLFPDGQFGKYHPRQYKLSHAEYDKSRLLNRDSRFRKDPQYVFFLLWQKEMRELAAGVYNLMKSSKTMPMSVTKLLHQVQTSNEQLEANLSTMLQTVRGTKQYWYRKKGDLMCMVREAGPPTLFLTFSCAEYEAPDIIDYLHIVNDVPENYNRGRLCIEDPISVSRQFSQKFHAFFQQIIVKGQVLGIVDHFFWKKEYQARGAPHYHVLLWIRDAPVIGVDDNSKVLQWIEERITCEIPHKETDPELHELVTRYLLHRCSAYCRRRRKCGNRFVTHCKFGFPREARETAIVHCVEEKLKKRQKIYNLARKESEVRVNDYNPLLLLLWKANCDIQFVAESSLALANYVTGYVTKPEKSSMQELWQEVGEAKSVYSRLWSFGVRALRSRESGLYEASDILLGDHLCEKSDTVQWLDVSMPHKRNRRLKDHKELVQMEATDPDSEDIYMENIHTHYYPGRPDELDDLCLHDFVANYNYYGKDVNGARKYKKLTKPRLVNHTLFDPNDERTREAYFYSLVLLFVPFRDETCLIQKDETAEEAFTRLLPASEECSAYHSRLQKMLEAKNNLRAINEARRENDAPKYDHKEDDDPQLPGQAKSAMEDMLDMNTKSGNDLTLEERVKMLNLDQRKIFDAVSNHLLHQKQHEDRKCDCTLRPLIKFVSGVAGTGKSFLIEAIKQLTESIWHSDDLKCAIAAPTGLAAFNVGGVTIHRLFQLPIEHEGKEAGYWALPKAAQKVMKSTLRSLKVLIIDEVSMLSSLNLAYIHLRMSELFGGDDWFGGINVLFVGDLLQLQPVNGSPIFETVHKKAVCLKLGCATSVNIWNHSVQYDELTINERQKKDEVFSAILDSVRQGCLTQEITALLQERVSDVTVSEKFTELQSLGMTPVCLFPTRKQCDKVNNDMLDLLANVVHVVPCTDEIDETKSTAKWQQKAAQQLDKLNRDCNNTAGLEAILRLAVGARVMLRRNIDVKAGLVNGAIGTIHAVLQTCVSVKFDHLSKLCDIQKVKGKFMVLKNYYVQRTQFPLILAYAVTIHKCQGLSLDCAIVDLSDKVFAAGMAYVAVSRLRSLAGLHLIAFDPKSIRVSVKCLTEINRLRKKYRKDLPLYKIPCLSSKRKLTGAPHGEPAFKKAHIDQAPKRKAQSLSANDVPSTKKQRSVGAAQPDKHKVWPFSFHSVDVQWQRSACQAMGLKFEKGNGVSPGSGDMPLTRPDMRSIKRILGDGNCMFRALSRIVSGSQNHYAHMREKIVQHLHHIAPLMLEHIVGLPQFNSCTSIEEYVKKTKMDIDQTWGTTIELLCFAHLTKTCVFSYTTEKCNWDRFGPHNVDNTLPVNGTAQSVYLCHPINHYSVVGSTVKVDNCTDKDCKSNGLASDAKPQVPNPTTTWLAAQSTRHVWEDLRFHCVDTRWQQDKCAMLGLPYHGPNGSQPGGENVLLTRPYRTKSIRGDGNCLFRCFSYIITGSEEHHMAVRLATVQHMHDIPAAIVQSNITSVQEYITLTGMDRCMTWGGDKEVRVLCHLLNTSVCVYVPTVYNWTLTSHELFEQNTSTNTLTQKTIYLVNAADHFTMVLSTMPHSDGSVLTRWIRVS